MRLGQYDFICRFTSRACLPKYKGAAFRGAFGRALRQSVCVLKARTCGNCPLCSQCLYAMVFETQNPLSPSEKFRSGAYLHPYVIEPPEIHKTEFFLGDDFTFRVLLFGDSVKDMPYFIHAFDQMGQNGIGRRSDSVLGTFALERVLWKEDVIYSQDDNLLRQPPEEELFLNVPQEIFSGKMKLKLRFQTPLRIKHENKIVSDIPFDLLIRVALRRLSMLLSNFDAGEPALDYSGLVRDAHDVSTLSSSLHWLDGKRYSFRQRQDMQMGGIIGDVVYEGKLFPFLPLLSFCSVVHIGKQTTFGLGRFDMEILM